MEDEDLLLLYLLPERDPLRLIETMTLWFHFFCLVPLSFFGYLSLFGSSLSSDVNLLLGGKSGTRGLLVVTEEGVKDANVVRVRDVVGNLVLGLGIVVCID